VGPPGKIPPEMRTADGGMPVLEIEVVNSALERLPDDVIVALAYGPGEASGAPGVLQTGLSTLDGVPALEVWRTSGAVTAGVDGPVRHCANREFLCGIIDLDESRFRGIADAAESAYRWIREFQERQTQRHLLRVWNFLDSINAGEGDLERYRQFCVGRARGLAGLASEKLPAATAVGRTRRTGRVQVCWLAGRTAGTPVENPRQVRAYLYPQQYGPSPPAFARGMRLDTGELMGSGTSSIVGHESRHEGDLHAQVDETIANLRKLHRAGGGAGEPAGLKVYLRDHAGASGIAEKIRAGLSAPGQPLLIAADICRRELLVEIECLWT
jgi:chorismate lyase/3-hydroxybenzoate synthase